MSRSELLALIGKGALVWIGLSLLGWYFSQTLGHVLLQVIRPVIVLTSSEISPRLKLIVSDQFPRDYSVEMTAWTLHPIRLNARLGIPRGVELASSAHLLHSLVPVIIQWTILLVWPVQNWRQRSLLIGTGLIATTFVVMATLPFLLLGKLEIAFQTTALQGPNPRPEPWYLDWMVFCEMGGGWLLAITAAWLCIGLQRILLREG